MICDTDLGRCQLAIFLFVIFFILIWGLLWLWIYAKLNDFLWDHFSVHDTIPLFFVCLAGFLLIPALVLALA